jgi:hypothetical protein
VTRLFFLQCGYFFFEEAFEFTLCEHAINDAANGLFIFVFELVNSCNFSETVLSVTHPAKYTLLKLI